MPHLYPLAKLVDNYPRYAAVMLDTNKARIFVFGLAATEREETGRRATRPAAPQRAAGRRRAISAAPTTSTRNHMKEVVDTLDKIVREENIDHIVVAGDDVAVPMLREQLPKQLADKIVDVIELPAQRRRGDSFLETTIDALREKDAETDVEKVQELMDAWQSGGLGVAGPEATLSRVSTWPGRRADHHRLAGNAEARAEHCPTTPRRRQCRPTRRRRRRRRREPA